MGWYVRRSLRMGPVRWNLSKSGIGMSVGIRGLRVGTGPRGAYVAGGRGGLYFRQQLGQSTRSIRPAQRHSQTSVMPSRSFAPAPVPSSSTPMQYLPETDVTQFTPASADALAQYIAAQRRHIAWFPWALGLLIFINLAILANVWPVALLVIPLSVFGAHYVYQWDRQRTHVALHYDLDGQEGQNFEGLCAGLAALASTARLQRVEARQLHGDWKHQAGTTTALKLAPASVLPPGRLHWLETNIPVWSIEWRQGGIALSFLPDRILIEQQHAVAAVPYANVQVSTTLGRFVESGRAPSDARILGYNWQYPNKDGSRDRRFNNNRQLPVIEVVYLGLQSAGGLQLLLQASNRQRAEGFFQSIQRYRPLMCAEVGVAH